MASLFQNIFVLYFTAFSEHSRSITSKDPTLWLVTAHQIIMYGECFRVLNTHSHKRSPFLRLILFPPLVPIKLILHSLENITFSHSPEVHFRHLVIIFEVRRGFLRLCKISRICRLIFFGLSECCMSFPWCQVVSLKVLKQS